MTFANIQSVDFPGATDYPFQNYSASVDIEADTVVSLDTTISDALSSKQGIGVVATPTASGPNQAIGVTLEKIPFGGSGRVRCFGPIVNVKMDGAVTVGGAVDASTTTAGRAKAHVAAKIQLGIALVTAADLETIPIMLVTAVNA